jgi:hypothetical protein
MTEKPTTDDEMEAFARRLTESCETHEAWLTVMRYGLSTPLDNQPLLVELLLREAVRRTDWSTAEPGYVPVKELRAMMSELGLRFEVAGAGEGMTGR